MAHVATNLKAFRSGPSLQNVSFHRAMVLQSFTKTRLVELSSVLRLFYTSMGTETTSAMVCFKWFLAVHVSFSYYLHFSFSGYSSVFCRKLFFVIVCFKDALVFLSTKIIILDVLTFSHFHVIHKWRWLFRFRNREPIDTINWNEIFALVSDDFFGFDENNLEIIFRRWWK